jgi:hypothetical protein
LSIPLPQIAEKLEVGSVRNSADQIIPFDTSKKRAYLGRALIQLQQFRQLLSLLCVFSNLGNLFFVQSYPNGKKKSHSLFA